jgi:hypothetical protein
MKWYVLLVTCWWGMRPPLLWNSVSRGVPLGAQVLVSLRLSPRYGQTGGEVLKGSVQRKLRWVENSAKRWVLAWDCGAEHYFEFLLCRHLVLNIFPFPVRTAKLIGDSYNNRRSAANSYPHFAYSFISLMLRQYYLSCDSYSTNRQRAANKKKSVKTSY